MFVYLNYTELTTATYWFSRFYIWQKDGEGIFHIEFLLTLKGHENTKKGFQMRIVLYFYAFLKLKHKSMRKIPPPKKTSTQSFKKDSFLYRIGLLSFEIYMWKTVVSKYKNLVLIERYHCIINKNGFLCKI